MKDKNTFAKLREICDMAHVITQEDKLYLKEIASAQNVKFNDCKTCPNIYRDLAIELYTIMAKKEKAQAGAYELKEGLDLIFGGVRVNAATLDDKLGDWLIKHGFDTRFFAKYPNADKAE